MKQQNRNYKIKFAIGFLLLSLLHCGESEEKKLRESNLLFQTIILVENYVYKYNCPQYTLLDAGTTTIHLEEGEEFWFDFRPRLVGSSNVRTFPIQIQEAGGQDIKLSTISCFANHILTNPIPLFVMNTPYFPDSNTTGQLETFNTIFVRSPEGEGITTIKALSGAGNVTITIPNQALED